MKFITKPIMIEAVPVRQVCSDAVSNYGALPKWVQDNYENGNLLFKTDGLLINTLEGELNGSIDDMLIRGVKGDIYPCKPDIFEATYEKV